MAQDEAQASYEGWCRRADVAIDWARPIDEVYNLIRGADPQPGAWTRCDGRMLQIYDAAKRPGGGEATPGEVTAAGPEGLEIAAWDGRIAAKRVRPEGEQKVAAGDFVAASGLKPGAVLG